jgi:enhancing lycopene biosynthesis protein 2
MPCCKQEAAMAKVGVVLSGCGVFVDAENRLVTTPCYMNDVGPWVVYQGADKMVEEVLRMTQPR